MSGADYRKIVVSFLAGVWAVIGFVGGGWFILVVSMNEPFSGGGFVSGLLTLLVLSALLSGASILPVPLALGADKKRSVRIACVGVPAHFVCLLSAFVAPSIVLHLSVCAVPATVISLTLSGVRAEEPRRTLAIVWGAALFTGLASGLLALSPLPNGLAVAFYLVFGVWPILTAYAAYSRLRSSFGRREAEPGERSSLAQDVTGGGVRGG